MTTSFSLRESLSIALVASLLSGAVAIARAQHPSDANIAALIDEANAGDSALASAALPNLTSKGARNFAQMMMGEHHALHVQGIGVEQQQHLTPELPSPDPFKPAVEAEQSALASMAKGKTYDSTYIAHEAAIHKAVIDWVTAADHQPQNAAYKAYLKNAGPVLVKHLHLAEELEQKMHHAKR